MGLVETSMLVVGAVLALGGLMALANVRGLFVDARKASRHAVRTTAHVVDLTEVAATGPDAGTSTWHPVVTFKDQDGNEHTVQVRYGTGPSKWVVGDPVKVAYPPMKPGEAEIDVPFMTYHSVLVALVIGVALLGLGLGLVLVALFGQ